MDVRYEDRLDEPTWTALEDAHVARMREWTVPHQRRRSTGRKHPVLDFLFTYYSHPPSHLERWQPGPFAVLTGPAACRFLDRTGYRTTEGGVGVDPSTWTAKRASGARYALSILEATAGRAPRLSCFGLHEWAMVYQQPADAVRHAQLPLRLGSAGTDEVVDSLGVRCGHYDAFRFFTPPAVPLNGLRPTRRTQADLEQPGCLHANMDLYKWAYKLSPFVPAELLGDCFALAAEIRLLDMRASPYDLSSLGHSPVRVETAEGRAEYARAQAGFADRATALRDRLIRQHRAVLDAF
ncbi:3-methyladenine DNA glycosylase [Prauserella marina]|uniref:Uncharacterized protein n=1 Tax=Prauserella marina TaxID=530584 RepID=A0A222VRB2_9PSEU|nr:3-methyladenine DNA glycosylase [Prauserella marina]ASR36457.1 3-methyladenine DNA glycosylase [Prauserella marina]PWV77273.1 hypothetical protein DES30_105490 [Prauserella marina]SDD08349.1 hypothetical protein SAMN05421630_105491 [Prauserella marina]